MLNNETIVLGISLGFDSGAAIISSTRGIIATINEERLNREKNTKKFPILSIKEVLKLAKLNKEDIDLIAYTNYECIDAFNFLKHTDITNPDLNKLFEKMKNNSEYLATYRFIENERIETSNITIKEKSNLGLHLLETELKSLGFDLKLTPLVRIEHHASHSIPAFVYSGFEDAIVITADGFGDNVSNRITYMDKNYNYEILNQTPLVGSIALIYQFVTGGVGYKMHQHEGKVTGLAARGDSTKTIEEFRKLCYYDTDIHEFKWMLPEFEETFVDKANPIENFAHFNILKDIIFDICKKYSKEDLAAGVQKFTEEIVTTWISDVLKMFSIKSTNICLAGGLFANVKLNQTVRELEECKDIFVFPAMGDTGGAVGAATAVLFDTHNIKLAQLNNLFYGSDITDEEARIAISDIESILHLTKNIKLDYEKAQDRSYIIAKLISEGNIVANVHGAMEYGPRALCHRSIHFNCDDHAINDWLNKQLGRSEFMPFCPVIQYEDAEKAFTDIDDTNKHAGEFMTLSYYASDLFKEQCPAGVHVDGTARAQLLRKELVPSIYDALTHYKEMTGRLGFINTSFNKHGEPIIRTAKEAINTFLDSNIHYLVLNDYVIKHPNCDELPKFKK